MFLNYTYDSKIKVTFITYSFIFRPSIVEYLYVGFILFIYKAIAYYDEGIFITCFYYRIKVLCCWKICSNKLFKEFLYA